MNMMGNTVWDLLVSKTHQQSNTLEKNTLKHRSWAPNSTPKSTTTKHRSWAPNSETVCNSLQLQSVSANCICLIRMFILVCTLQHPVLIRIVLHLNMGNTVSNTLEKNTSKHRSIEPNSETVCNSLQLQCGVSANCNCLQHPVLIRTLSVYCLFRASWFPGWLDLSRSRIDLHLKISSL